MNDFVMINLHFENQYLKSIGKQILTIFVSNSGDTGKKE